MGAAKLKQINSRISEDLWDRVSRAARAPEYQPGGKSEFARRAFEAELARGAGLLEATDRDLVVNARTGEVLEVHVVEAAASVELDGQGRAAAAGVEPIDLAEWILGRPGWADRYSRGKLNFLIFGGRVLVGGMIHREELVEPGRLGRGVEVAGEPVL